MATDSARKPWKHPAPKKSAHTKLTPKSRARAKAAAKRAGRRYPNLVDNMRAAQAQNAGGRSKSRSRPT